MKLLIFLSCMVLGTLSILDRTFYNTLKVPISAKTDQIKEAFRKLSRKYHPDRNPKYRSKFQKINVAYETLSNEQKRYVYDRVGHEKMNNPDVEQEYDLQTMKGNNLEVGLSLKLEDLYQGKTIISTIFKKMACPHCLGSGAQNPYDLVRCSECQGKGKTTKRVQMGGGYYNMVSQTCKRCHGEGKIIGRKCETCKAAKIISGSEEFKVKIAAGSRNGQVLKYLNMGQQRLDGAPGDLFIRIYQLPHPKFTRYGNNLLTNIHISLKQALSGFTRTVTQLDGRELKVESSKITQPGQIFVLEGQGMPIKDTQNRGNLHVTAIVSIPQYSSSQIDQLIKVMDEFS